MLISSQQKPLSILLSRAQEDSQLQGGDLKGIMRAGTRRRHSDAGRADNGEQSNKATEMNVVILYEAVELAIKAKSTLSRAVEALRDSLELQVKPWRLEFLTHPATKWAAINDLFEADLVLLAVDGKRDTVARLLEALEHWAKQRITADAAIAVFPTTRPNTEVDQFARSYGLNFISPGSNAAENAPVSFPDDPVSLHERQVTQTAVMQQMLARTESSRN